jgi:hypothetical protein
MESSAPQSVSASASTAAASVDDAQASVAGDPTRSEVAAIAAAIAARRAERTRALAQAAAAGDIGWTGRRWQFAGRIDRLQDQDARPTDGAPTDPWAAAGRTQRMK